MSVKVTGDGIIVTIYVHPSARQDRVDTTDGIEIHTREPPEGNRANIAVIKMLSKRLKIPRSQVSIVRGGAGRVKEIRIVGIRPEDFKRLM